MSNILDKKKPPDVVALVVLCAGFTLIYLGRDGIVGSLLTMVVAFYFGEKVVQDRIEKKKSN